MRYILAFFPISLLATTGLSVQSTNTQAVFSYTAPDTAACTLEVSESPTYTPLVNDVDTALFAGSASDSRSGNVVSGRSRQFVVGKRAAETATDGRRYSRALQASTLHFYRLTCGASVATGVFQTQTIPWGTAVGNALPDDGSGGYAWPSVSWADRSERHIDPLTGSLMRRISLPSDQTEDSGDQSILATPAPSGTNWTTPDNVRVDDSAVASYATTTSDWLYMPAGPSMYYEYATFLRQGAASVNGITLFMNAWGAATPSADRTVQICLTVDGVSCASSLVDSILPQCASSCTAGNRFTVGNNTPIQAFWGNSPIPSPDIAARSGNVNTNGTAVTFSGGNYFGLRWAAGTRITINGTPYTIASMQSERELTLTSSAGVQTNVTYSARPFGFLLRKKSASADSISVQFARWAYQLGQGVRWDNAGDAEVLVGCSAVAVAGPGGEMGYHCHAGYGLYWLGASTGTSTKIGLTNLPSGTGFSGVSQCAPYWDTVNGNAFYCLNPSGDIIRAVYSGSNTDVGSQSYLTTLTVCGSPPCWTLTKMNASPILPQIQTLAAECSAMTTIGAWGGQANYMVIEARTVSTNDVLGCVSLFDLTTGTIVAARSTWKTWPTRWGTLHGGATVGSSTVAFFPQQQSFFPNSRGGGPWRTQITSGAINTASGACPSRPTGSVIPADQWPSGNDCITITVAGEPCDPDPQGGDPTNPAKCAVPTDGYLQDAEPGDLFCINDSGSGTCGLYFSTEFVRILTRSGLSWTIQRKMGTAGTKLAAGSGAYLYAMPPTCLLNNVYPCGGSDALWSFATDPNGTSTTAIQIDNLRNGTGHVTNRPGGVSWSTVQDTGPSFDGNGYGYYSTSVGPLSNIYSVPPQFVAGNPPWANLTGAGNPNPVDGHPSQPHYLAEQGTFFDFRPYLGQSGVTGTSGSPGTTVAGTLYRFTSGQVGKLRRKQFPTWAACANNPMTDVSSPATGDVIGGADSYKYCVAANANECRTGSSAGDVYANCPLTFSKWSVELGAGVEDPERRWIAVTDAASYAHGSIEVGLQGPELFGRRGRQVSYAFQRYAHVNVFANLKGTAYGEWYIVQSPWVGDIRAEAWAIKRTPTQVDSVNRGSFSLVSVTGAAPVGADRMLVQFGYDPSFRCTSRNESCYAVSSTLNETTPFLWGGELVNGSGSTTGAVSVPAIPGRVVYWRVIWRASGDGRTVAAGPAVAVAVK